MKTFRNAVFSGLAFGILMGLYYGIAYDIRFALIGGPLSGFAFGCCMYFLVKSKLFKRQTQIVGAKESEIIRTDPANHFKSIEAVGGRLYLFPDRLVFKSHKINIQNHELTIGLADIQEVSLYKIYGIVPTGLKVILKNGMTEKFVVNNRKIWLKEIESHIH